MGERVAKKYMKMLSANYQPVNNLLFPKLYTFVRNLLIVVLNVMFIALLSDNSHANPMQKRESLVIIQAVDN